MDDVIINEDLLLDTDEIVIDVTPILNLTSSIQYSWSED